LSKLSFSPEAPADAGARKFTPSLFPEGPNAQKSFQADSPLLPAPQGIFPFGQSLKELEERILKEVKNQSLRIEKDAYEKGFAAGEKDGLELGFRRFETVLQSFQKVLEAIQGYQREFYRKHEREMMQFLLTLVRKILRQEVPHAEEVITATLREAFQYVEERNKVRVHLNPKDCEFLMTHPDRLPFPLSAESSEGVKIVADSSLLRGGCFLETSFGNIDATLESQLDQVTAGIWQKIDSLEDRPLESNP
jgi:flagellar assembly protein FliH